MKKYDENKPLLSLINIITLLIPTIYFYINMGIKAEEAGGGNNLGEGLSMFFFTPLILIIGGILIYMSKFFDKFNKYFSTIEFKILKNLFIISILFALVEQHLDVSSDTTNFYLFIIFLLLSIYITVKVTILSNKDEKKE